LIPQNHFEGKDVVEGEAKLQFPLSSRVFYNPKMRLNRDVAVLLIKSYFESRPIRICDPMTASGVRTIRFLLECAYVDSVVASDVDPVSAEFANRMLQLNELSDRASVTSSEANALLSNSADRFDLVDLDPFGSPAPFFESALRATADGGILAATATDMAPLTGARANACFRKYNVMPLRAEFDKENAVRVLIACLCFASARLELGFRVVFSHASDHYARVYVQVKKGRKAANEMIRSIGYLEYCPDCMKRVQRLSLAEIKGECEDCRLETKIGGPIWLGQLWDKELVRKMGWNAVTISSSHLSDLQKLLGRIQEEAEAPPFYYRVDTLVHRLRTNPPKVTDVVAALRADGYMASLTHFHPNGFRTDAPQLQVMSKVAELAKGNVRYA